MERSTRDRWALTVHMIAAATASFQGMSGTSAGSSFHSELGSQRIERDEYDVNNLIQCIEPGKSICYLSVRGRKDATDQYHHWDSCTSEVSESLLSAKEQGEKAMGEFVQARLISDKGNFPDHLKKTTSKPFKV